MPRFLPDTNRLSLLFRSYNLYQTSKIIIGKQEMISTVSNKDDRGSNRYEYMKMITNSISIFEKQALPK